MPLFFNHQMNFGRRKQRESLWLLWRMVMVRGCHPMGSSMPLKVKCASVQRSVINLKSFIVGIIIRDENLIKFLNDPRTLQAPSSFLALDSDHAFVSCLSTTRTCIISTCIWRNGLVWKLQINYEKERLNLIISMWETCTSFLYNRPLSCCRSD